jgi:hypothetical protein
MCAGPSHASAPTPIPASPWSAQRVTRSIFEVLERYRHPVMVLTKSTRVLCDLELLQSLATDELESVGISILRALAVLAAAGILSRSHGGARPRRRSPITRGRASWRALRGALRAGPAMCGCPMRSRISCASGSRRTLLGRAAHVMSLIPQMRAGAITTRASAGACAARGLSRRSCGSASRSPASARKLNGHGRPTPRTRLSRPPQLPGTARAAPVRRVRPYRAQRCHGGAYLGYLHQAKGPGFADEASVFRRSGPGSRAGARGQRLQHARITGPAG